MINGKEYKCKLCGGDVKYLFSIPLVNILTGEYYECNNCFTLQSNHLDKLSKEQKTNLLDSKNNSRLDSGSAWRQYCIVRKLLLLSTLRIIPSLRNAKILDYGCGSGFSVGFLNHKCQANAFGYDPYSQPYFSQDRIFRNFDDVKANGPYQIIIASEVFEHFLHPCEEINRLANLLSRKKSSLYITTGRYRPGVITPTWDYFAPQSGEHVTFYSDKSMKIVGEMIGKRNPMNVGAEYEWLFINENHDFFQFYKILMSSILCLSARIGLLEKIV